MVFGKYPPERPWCVKCDTGRSPHQAGCPNSPKWPPDKESAWPANPAPQGEQQQQEPSSDGQSRSRERLHDCPPTVWDAAGRPIQAKEDRLIEALKTQTKALEEYTKATANLTIHIGLLIQAMAEDQDDEGDGPNLRTLG